MEHSKVVSGSIAKRVRCCPGSVPLSQSAPPQPESKYAAEGTMLHAVIEQLMLSDPEPDVRSMIGFQSHGETFTEEHVPCIEHALAEWNRLADQFGIDDFDCEQKCDWEKAIPGAFSWVDVIASGPDYNMILDWKFGRGIRVSAEDNDQMKFCAVGAMLTDGLGDLFDPSKPTVMVIIQPRIEDGTTWSVVQTEQLNAYKLAIIYAVKRSQAKTPPLATGDHCRWCPAATICPKKIGQMENLPDPLNRERMAELLDLADEAEHWVKAVREQAYHDADNGRVPSGWKLVAKRARSRWTDPEAAETYLRKKEKMKVKDIVDRQLKSPTQVAKILGKVLPQDIVTRASSGTTLVRDSDPRQAIVPLANAFRKIS